MADSIVRLKVDSQEYDAKIKRAADGLQNLGRSLHEAGNTFADADEKQVEFVRELGKMETVSKTTKGSINEMTHAFTELSVTYSKMTDEEKQSPFGKALSSSLDELKGRIREGKTELEKIGQSLQDTSSKGSSTGGMIDTLTDKFTVNIDAMKLFNMGLQAAEGALSVAKDAFFASEQNVDEWGRVVASSQSVYEGFLTAINNGDISGFLTNIDDIVRAARKAYDELDRLGTMKTIQSPQFSKQEAENNRMRLMLMTGRYIEPGDGQRAANGLKNGDLLSPEQLRNIEKHLQNGMTTIVNLTKNEIDQTGRAINAYYDKLAKQNGMTMAEFRKGTSSMAEFDKRIKGYQNYQKFEREHTTTVTMTGTNGLPISQSIRDNAVNPYAQYRNWGTFRVDKMGENSFNDLVGLIRQQQQQQSQMYSTLGQAYRTINRAEGVTVRDILGGGGSAGGGGTHTPKPAKTEIVPEEGMPAYVKAIQKELQGKLDFEKDSGIRQGLLMDIEALKEEYQQMTTLPKIGDELSDDFTEALSPLQQLNAELKELREQLEMSPDTAEYQNRLQAIADKEQEIKKFKGETDSSNEAKSTAKAWQTAAGAVQSVGSALQSLEDPSAKIVGIIGQAVANIALGFAQATAKDTKLGVWGWIASVAGGLSTMVSTISAIHSATGYAEGGIVKGTTYSGDQIPAMLNAGEVVLSASQQNTLAQDLQGAGVRNLQLSAVLTAEQIKLTLNNNGRRWGKGELVTTNFRQ
jgi:hypothetical protein